MPLNSLCLNRFLFLVAAITSKFSSSWKGDRGSSTSQRWGSSAIKMADLRKSRYGAERYKKPAYSASAAP